MQTVNIHEAKTHLSRLIESIESGTEAEVVIARNGKPAARLVPLENPRKKIRFGLAKGTINLPDDFDADNDYIRAMMEGRIDA